MKYTPLMSRLMPEVSRWKCWQSEQYTFFGSTFWASFFFRAIFFQFCLDAGDAVAHTLDGLFVAYLLVAEFEVEARQFEANIFGGLAHSAVIVL